MLDINVTTVNAIHIMGQFPANSVTRYYNLCVILPHWSVVIIAKIRCVRRNGKNNSFIFVKNTSLFPVRFFVVEDHILSTTSGLVSRAYIDELWDMALSKVVAVLRTHIVSSNCVM